MVTPRLADVRAFDSGPGNMIIDAAVAVSTDGALQYDEDGRIATSAEPDEDVLHLLMQDPYLLRRPPKSTGREHWGAQYVQEVIQRTGLSGAALVSTMTEFAARSIADAYMRFVLPAGPLEGVYLSGGGARNPVLVDRITSLLDPIPVRSSDDLGLPVDFKEAVAFAILANETLCGSPSNVPGATGASGPRVLGTICPGA